jgi:hypothetical protein
VKRLILLVLVSSCVGSELKIYGVKSGYVEYEHRSFYLHTRMHVINGREVSVRERVPFVDRKIYMYFEDYGCKVYEVAYEVSRFFGRKKIDPPRKLYEIVKKEGRLYAYKRGRVSVQRRHLADECKAQEELCRSKGWYEVLYPHAKKIHPETIAGKRTTCYKESEYGDDCLWRHIVLKQTLYSTQRNRRFEIESQKIAIAVDTDKTVDNALFNPRWIEEKK